MRIYGGQTDHGQRQDARERRAAALKRFKRNHKSGDLVTGVFLRLEPVPAGTAWVSFEGAALLAALPEGLAALARRIAAGQGAGAMPTGVTEADFPIKRGQTCYFILDAVEPEPVLRMLDVHGTALGGEAEVAKAVAEARWQSVLRLPPAQLAARYTQKRTYLDQELRQNLWADKDLAIPFPHKLPAVMQDLSVMQEGAGHNAPDSPQERYKIFLQSSGGILQNFTELELYRSALLENLRPYGLLGFFHVPWLCPASRSLELAFFRQSSKSGDAALGGASGGQKVSFKLQGFFINVAPAEQAASSVAITKSSDENTGLTKRIELYGELGGKAWQRYPNPDEPDLLQQILALKPDAAYTGFSRKA